MVHAEWGPSRAPAYTRCHDYVNANRGLEEPSGELMRAASEGTFAHMISDTCLKLGYSAFDFIGKREVVNGLEFDWKVEDATLLQRGIDRVRAVKGSFYGEQRVDVSEWTTADQFGTLDRCVIGEGFVYVNDLKWGRGLSVSPVRNLQMTLYTLGLWKANEGLLGRDCRFILEVDQPRIKGAGGVWSTTLDELEEIGAWIKQQVDLGLQPNPSRMAGPVQCAFCRRKRAPKGCHVYDDYLVKLTTGLPLPTSLTASERCNILENKDMIVRWLNELEALTLEEGLHGDLPEGYKVVEGRRGRGFYIDEMLAEQTLECLLGDKSYNKKLISPSVAAKLLDKETWLTEVRPLVQQGECKPVLVPESDQREPLHRNLDNIVDEVEE